MKVLMFGWEYAPMYSGGLGVVSSALTKSLAKKDIGVTFVIPKRLKPIKTQIELVSAAELMEKVDVVHINSPLKPYASAKSYKEDHYQYSDELYSDNLYEEVERYAESAKKIAQEKEFDVIHAHDWMTFKAGINAKKESGKPLVVHIHNTVFDRMGSDHEYNMEKTGFEEADKIIAVSNYTKKKLVEKYGIRQDKIEVVHNAIDFSENETDSAPKIPDNDKMVLFLGRVTVQKGPDYFVEAAKKVLDICPNTRFVIAGGGDMQGRMIERAASLGIGHKVLFTGAIPRDEATKLYQMADVYVMPSVSEPFGITPLEAIYNGAPAIISKNSGVSEVIKNALMIDFWDIDEITNKIVAVLKYPFLRETLVEQSTEELKKLNWDDAAEKCISIYHNLAGGRG